MDNGSIALTGDNFYKSTDDNKAYTFVFVSPVMELVSSWDSPFAFDGFTFKASQNFIANGANNTMLTISGLQNVKFRKTLPILDLRSPRRYNCDARGSRRGMTRM